MSNKTTLTANAEANSSFVNLFKLYNPLVPDSRWFKAVELLCGEVPDDWNKMSLSDKEDVLIILQYADISVNAVENFGYEIEGVNPFGDSLRYELNYVQAKRNRVTLLYI